MNCGDCGHEVDADTKFCEECGSPIGHEQSNSGENHDCINCGNEISANSKFCKLCGARQESIPNASSAHIDDKHMTAKKIKIQINSDSKPSAVEFKNILSFSLPQFVGLASCLLCFIGAFLPWRTLGIISVSGFDVESGVITLCLSIFAGIIILKINEKKPHFWSGLALIGIGAMVVLIAVGDLVYTNDHTYAHAGAGSYLTLICGVGIAYAGMEM